MYSLIHRYSAPNSFAALTTGIILITFLVDIQTQLGFAIWGFYLPAIVSASFWKGKRAIVPTTLTIMAITVLGAWVSPGGAVEYGIPNRVIGIVSIGLVGWLCVWLVETKRTAGITEARFGRLIDSMDEGVWGLDREGRTTFINPAASTILGYSPDGVIGRTMHDLIRHSHRDGSPCQENDCPITSTYRRGQHQAVEEDLFWKRNGTACPVSYTASPIYEEETLTGAVVTFQNLTDRKFLEAQYKLAVEHAPNGILLINHHGTIALVNAKIEQLFAYGREELLGQPIECLIPDRYRMSHPAQMSQFFAHPSIRPMGARKDLFARRKDGSEFEVEIGLAPFPDPRGQPLVMATIVDISARKQAEGWFNALVRSSTGSGHHFFQSLVKELQGHLGTRYAFVGRLQPGNDQRIETIAVCRDGTLLNNIAYDLNHTPCDDVLRQGVTFIPHHAQQRYPNDRMLVEMGVESYYGFPLTGSSGKAIGLITVVHDQPLEESELAKNLLTVAAARAAVEIERADATGALRESELRYRLLLDHAIDVIYRTDTRGRFTYFNPMAVEVTGYADHELIGRRFVHIIRADYRAQIRFFYNQQFRKRLTNTYLEFPIVRKDGREVWVGQNVQTLVESDKVIGFQAIVRDLTDRRKNEDALRTLNEQLEHRVRERTAALSQAYESLRLQGLEQERVEQQFRQAQKLEAVGQLAGGIAHDFNNALTAILGYCELLLNGLPQGHRLREYAARIRETGERSSSLTKRLLTFSRHQVFEPKATDLNVCVANVVAMITRMIEPMTDVVLDLASSPVFVLADSDQLEQALLNLAINARDAMPSGGRLVITTQCVGVKDHRPVYTGILSPGCYGLLSVQDTGIGMDAHTRARMFEPFFTTKGREKGSGLGLAMVHGTVIKASGLIDVQTQLDQGTTVTLYFPATAVPDVSTVPLNEDKEAGTASSNNPGGETILLVEDDETVRYMTRAFLTDAGYLVVEAADGAAGLRICEDRQQRIDLLLTDMIMPKMNGRELAEQVRQIRAGLRIILMSGYTDDAVISEAIDTLKLEFLSKPFLPANLIKKVRALLDAPLAA